MAFEFPRIHNFPPFYTQQPNEQTWAAQRTQWISLVLAYCAHHRVWVLNNRGLALSRGDVEMLDEEQATEDANGSDMEPLFENKGIDRRLDVGVVSLILNEMVSNGDAAFVNKKDTSQIFVYWHRPDDWAAKILEWVEATGQSGVVLTLYELAHGDLSLKQEFHGIHPQVLETALQVLVKRGRAQLLKDEDGKIAGVKIQ